MEPKPLHPDLTREERHGLFWRGIELFNRGDLFACHEAWEEIWRSTTPEPRDLFQGLIQVAVGFYHFQERGRADVALRVLAKGRQRLQRVLDRPHGLDLGHLLREMAAWEDWLRSPSGEKPALPKLCVREPDAVG